MAEIRISGGILPPEEIDRYVEYVRAKAADGEQLETLEISVDGDFVDLKWEFHPRPFERIRRITGYLVGTMDRWNDAKTAEERDRVKHIWEEK